MVDFYRAFIQSRRGFRLGSEHVLNVGDLPSKLYFQWDTQNTEAA